jgi:hypothetical protein
MDFSGGFFVLFFFFQEQLWWIQPTSTGSWIEAPLITREVLPETYIYFLLVVMAADAQARPFFRVSSIMLMWNLVNF